MEATLIFLLCFSVLLVHSEVTDTTLATSKPSSVCGDWTPYEDDKCIIVVSNAGYQSQEDAEIVCESFKDEFHRDFYPRLITIKTKEEQDFFQKFLFVENDIKGHVWLGLKEVRKTGYFAWNDGSKPYFTNWINQTIPDDQHHCVQIESGGSVEPIGSWVKVTCDQVNTVVCERPQILSLEMLQNMFQHYKLEQRLKDDAILQDVAYLKQNPVPIGFIYAQLPDQDPPTIIWPGTSWADISSKYAGLFFRVVGGTAAPFGHIQEGNSSRLEQVQYSTSSSESDNNALTIPPGGSWSKYIALGYASSTWRYTRFRLSGEEVRPRNQAMKVWQRNK